MIRWILKVHFVNISVVNAKVLLVNILILNSKTLLIKFKRRINENLTFILSIIRYRKNFEVKVIIIDRMCLYRYNKNRIVHQSQFAMFLCQKIFHLALFLKFYKLLMLLYFDTNLGYYLNINNFIEFLNF